MTPHEWNVALAASVHWRRANAVIEAETRKLLLTLPEGKVLNTGQLVEALYPAETARGPEIVCRHRIVRALMNPAMLADCRTRDEVNVRHWYGRKVKPWLWHRPKEKRCPHCGGIL